MKKNYIKPEIETTFYEPILMETATKMSGTVYDGDGDNIGEIDYGGSGSSGDNPSAKASSIWDDWTAEGEEEE